MVVTMYRVVPLCQKTAKTYGLVSPTKTLSALRSVRVECCIHVPKTKDPPFKYDTRL